VGWTRLAPNDPTLHAFYIKDSKLRMESLDIRF